VAQDKKSAEAVRHEVAQLKEEIEVLRERARELGRAFSSLDENQLTKKVKGQSSNSPFAFATSWLGVQTSGGPADFSVQVRNPDPGAVFPVYATIFFGLGNFFSADQAWAGRDRRWPEFSSDRTFFPANSTLPFSFNYTVPLGLPLGTYNGNWVLWRGEFFDVGAVFDRGSFDVKLL